MSLRRFITRLSVLPAGESVRSLQPACPTCWSRSSVVAPSTVCFTLRSVQWSQKRAKELQISMPSTAATTRPLDQSERNIPLRFNCRAISQPRAKTARGSCRSRAYPMASSLSEPMRFERAPLWGIPFRSGARQETDKRHPETPRQRSFSRGVVETGGHRPKRPLSRRNQTPYRDRSRTGVGARLGFFLLFQIAS
jgi:hypothetical protein